MPANTATHPVLEAIQTRISTNFFDPTRPVPRELLQAVVEAALHAPSSWNLQPWRYLILTEQADRERLKAVAYGQEKVAAAPAVLVALGDLNAVDLLHNTLQPVVDAKVLTPELQTAFVEQAAGVYQYPQIRNDDTIKNTTIGVTHLMLAAHAYGLSTGPMSGFDPQALKQAFNISDRYLPVMLLPIGYPAAGNWPRKPRLPLSEVLFWDSSQLR